jgi:hypothetical protein
MLSENKKSIIINKNNFSYWLDNNKYKKGIVKIKDLYKVVIIKSINIIALLD